MTGAEHELVVKVLLFVLTAGTATIVGWMVRHERAHTTDAKAAGERKAKVDKGLAELVAVHCGSEWRRTVDARTVELASKERGLQHQLGEHRRAHEELKDRVAEIERGEHECREDVLKQIGEIRGSFRVSDEKLAAIQRVLEARNGAARRNNWGAPKPDEGE